VLILLVFWLIILHSGWIIGITKLVGLISRFSMKVNFVFSRSGFSWDYFNWFTKPLITGQIA